MMTLQFTHRLRLVVLLGFFGVSLVHAASEPAQVADEYVPRLEKILTQNIEPFWYEKSLDRANGGYIISFDQQGKLKEPVTKMIVTQARQVWLFSRLARAGYEPQKHLEAAELGYRFLKDKMWDPTHGGFYWEVDVTGNQKLKPNKHLYGQSFGLYALSEYYLASGRQEVLDFAVQFFDLLEEKSHDKAHGGYVESFNPDWTPSPAGENSYMGAPAGLKLMNTHLHLLEALTTFYRASELPLARERLLELINIESNTSGPAQTNTTRTGARDWRAAIPASPTATTSRTSGSSWRPATLRACRITPSWTSIRPSGGTRCNTGTTRATTDSAIAAGSIQ
jgi:hypothetical protein